jgi:PKD repeat protein
MFLEKRFGQSNTETLAVIQELGEEWNWDFWMDNRSLWHDTDILTEEQKRDIMEKWVGYSKGKALWVTGKYGAGKVIAFGGHPEITSTWQEQEYGSPPRVVYNAIFYACSEGPYKINLVNSVSFSKIKAMTIAQNEASLGFDIDFHSIVINGTPPFDYYWDFGDESRSTFSDPVHNYWFDTGNLTIILGIADNERYFDLDFFKIKLFDYLNTKIPQHLYMGFINEPILFSVDISGGIEPFSWSWNFGDGNYSNEQSTTYMYNTIGQYNCRVNVIDKYGDTDSSFCKVIINKQDNDFKAFIKTTPIVQTIDKNLTITINVSKPDEYKYKIDFGDHKYLNIDSFIDELEISVNHVYEYYGNYDIIVEIENRSGGKYIVHKRIRINGPPIGPWIYFYNSNKKLLSGRKISFEVDAYDPEKENLWLKIDFGDGYISENNETTTLIQRSNGYTFYNVIYTWKKPGKYQIKAKAIDENGFESEWSDPYSIKIERPRLIDIILEKIK